jgi:enoyl-CoA hydratase/carnithine racemase
MLKTAREGGTLTLTLDRPERGNALGPDLVEALLAALAPSATADVHSVVLRTSGPHFCTGLDLSDLETATDGDLLHRLVRIETLLAALWHAPFHTAVVARGRCWGAGADLFAACERRIATNDASFRFPGAQFGIVLGTRRLAERVGADAAREIVLNGVEWDAQRALAAGLATGIDEEPSPAPPRVSPRTAEAIRAATRPDLRDADLAALVRSAAEPGLKGRIADYRARLTAARKPRD